MPSPTSKPDATRAAGGATKGSAGLDAECLHSELRAGEPIFYVDADCVNVEYFCTRCGKNVAVDSWTLRHWNEDQRKLQQRRGR